VEKGLAYQRGAKLVLLVLQKALVDNPAFRWYWYESFFAVLRWRDLAV